jgi:hypothetical protein
VSTPGGRPSADNPFSTRCVRPGAIAYRFPPGKSVDAVLARLERNGGRGQIVGPHGSGKSALVGTLQATLPQSGRPTRLIGLHDRQRRLSVSHRRLKALAPGTVVIVDGYEQLGLFSRLRLRRLCRRQGLGLVVTAHCSVGFPDLFRTTTSVALARRIVDELLAEEVLPLTPEEVAARFRQREGNLREVLFDLYDLYEQQRHQC